MVTQHSMMTSVGTILSKAFPSLIPLDVSTDGDTEAFFSSFFLEFVVEFVICGDMRSFLVVSVNVMDDVGFCFLSITAREHWAYDILAQYETLSSLEVVYGWEFCRDTRVDTLVIPTALSLVFLVIFLDTGFYDAHDRAWIWT